MAKRKKNRTPKQSHADLMRTIIQQELQLLNFKELKAIYEEEETDNNMEKYIQQAALAEMKRRNPHWDPLK